MTGTTADTVVENMVWGKRLASQGAKSMHHHFGQWLANRNCFAFMGEKVGGAIG